MSITDFMNEVDMETKSLIKRIRNPKISLIGNSDSSFLQKLKKKAEDFGFDVILNTYLPNIPTYIDIATANSINRLNDIEDIDNLYQTDTSAMAEAILQILLREYSLSIHELHTVIIGRDHNVKYLEENLQYLDGTVSICHTNTPKEMLLNIIKTSNVVINSTSQDYSDKISSNQYYIDINTEKPKEIYDVAISILLCRAVNNIIYD